MKDTRAMAYVNMYGVLGALENLCALDAVAREILAALKRPVSLCFDVKDGPCCTFHFSREGCRMEEGRANCTCRMRFSSPEAFNALIDRSKPFTQLTNRLTALLRPSEEALRERAFFEESTLLTLYVVAGAISALANEDPIARLSASYTVDGEISLGVRDVASVTIAVKEHHFTTIKAPSAHPRVIMEFADLDLAHGLFTGTASTIDEMCRGTIRLAGMISMADNVNRILDRVSLYLG